MGYNDTFYVTGSVQKEENLPADKLGHALIGLVLDPENDRILDVSINGVSPVAEMFFKQLLVDREFLVQFNLIIAELKIRYFGTTKEALIGALYDLKEKYEKALRETALYRKDKPKD